MDEIEMRQWLVANGDTAIVLSDSFVCGYKVKTSCWEYASHGFFSPESGAFNGCCYRWIQLFNAVDAVYFGFSASRAVFTEPLEGGKVYNFSIRLKMMPGSKPFSAMDFTVLSHPFDYPPFAEYENTEKIRTAMPQPAYTFHGTVDSIYREVAFKYVAKGGERFVYIGNTTAAIPASFKIKQASKGYLVKVAIDDFKVFAIDDTMKTPATGKTATLQQAELATIYFHTDSFALTKEAFNALETVCGALIGAIEVVVEGFADSSGTEEYNQQLSEKRAKAVADFIREKCGIAATVKGFGSMYLLPLSSNIQSNRKAVLKATYRQ